MARKPVASLEGKDGPQHPEYAYPALAVRDSVHFPGLIQTVLIVREKSVRAIRQALDSDRLVVVQTQVDPMDDDPTAEHLHSIGTLSEVLQALPLPDGSQRVILKGLNRVRSNAFVAAGIFYSNSTEIEEISPEASLAEAMMRRAGRLFAELAQKHREIPPEAMHGLRQLESAGLLADTIAHHLPLRAPEKQQFLSELDVEKRLEHLITVLQRELNILELDQQIHTRIQREMTDSQRQYYLREQLRAIQEELHELEDVKSEVERFRDLMEENGMPLDVREGVELELRRLERLPTGTQESAVQRNFLEAISSLPWAVETKEEINLQTAKRCLDERHFGIESVKERILDHLAVRSLGGAASKGSVICLVGPPGVGKTTLGQAIADAMNRKFVRIALGGVRDEAEIRGHRRAYVGAGLGRILSGLRDCGSRNPVMMLDEIDKVDDSGQGSVTSALLEVLDPEQNERFRDHFLEVPFDLSQVMFIATANDLDAVPGPLRDRLELITIPSYTEAERETVAQDFLLPRRLAEHGLSPADIELSPEILRALIRDHLRESGVRGLNRAIAKLCRKAARQKADGGSSPFVVTRQHLREYFGAEIRTTEALRTLPPGVVQGLVVGSNGGGVMDIEIAVLKPLGPDPEMRLTGSLGAVMQESAQAALTALRQILPHLNYSRDIHVHLPHGAIPKDGPSAGITLAVALASALTSNPVDSGIAMTGEITLTGRVMAVGGIREKVVAAAREGLYEVILPAENEGDLDEVPDYVKAQVKLRLVHTLSEVLTYALPQVLNGER
jgi:ATP-dependent Lon protease